MGIAVFKRGWINLLLFALPMLTTSCVAQRYELSKKDTAEVQWNQGKKFYLYKVEKSETLYSITKRFGVTEEELRKYNPELKDGLKHKMQLLIPAAHPEAKAEDPRAAEKKKTATELKIGIFLPLHTWKNLLPDSIYEDSARHLMDAETVAQLEFYEGALLAAESLASKDLKIHLSVFDTENDSAKLNSTLRDPKMKELSYLVVAGNVAVIKKLNHFSLQHKIPLLTYALNSPDQLKNNPQAYALSPSSVTQCYEAGRESAQRFANSNAFVIKTGSARDEERALAFSNGWNDHSETKSRSVDYSKVQFTGLLAVLGKDRNNVLFVPTSNEDLVNDLATKLNDTVHVYPVTVIGIPTWQNFGSNDPGVMENLKTHLFTASGLEVEDPKSMQFRRQFRRGYITDPTESAFQGYDAVMLIANVLSRQKSAADAIPEYSGMYARYRFKASHGLQENQYIRMIRFENYKLVEAR